jgi:DNA-binding response OmpR family regulator
MFSNGRVLIAESETTLRELFHRKLLDRGVACDAAANGPDAIAKFDEGNYELVLLDLALPIVGALQVFQRIASMRASDRPIVMALAGDHDARLLEVDLVQVVLRKPFDVEAIAEIVRSCLRSTGDGEFRKAPDVPPRTRRELRNN